MTNVDQRLASYRDRVLRLESEKREAADMLKDIRKEMKSNGLGADEIAGIFLAVKRSFESSDKAAKRTAAEHVADMLALEGAPLFSANRSGAVNDQ